MQLLDRLTIPRKSGPKSIELYHGDLTAMPDELAADVLVVSAWPDNYDAEHGTLIGALDRKGISVASLARNKAVDLRQMFSCWMSAPIAPRIPGVNFSRILCFEPRTRGEPGEVVGDIFQSLMPFVNADPPIKRIAMPVVATGKQNVPIADILDPLIDAAVHWLEIGLPVETLMIVELAELKAAELKGAFAILKRRITRHAQWTPEYSHDVFVSYSHRDTEPVLAIVNALQAVRPPLRVFLDRNKLNLGMAWQQELFEALDDCHKVIAVYSPDYLESKVCKEEFNIALSRHRETENGVLAPILLRDAPLPTYMKLIQHLDFRGKAREDYQPLCMQLLSALKI